MKSTGCGIPLGISCLVTLLAAFSPPAFAQTSPVPFVQSLSPASAAPGGSGFTLTVNGTGFASGSVVNWNGGARSTAFVSAKQLTATITSVDISAPGTPSITVTSPAPGGGTSNAVFFSITPARPSISLNTSEVTITGATGPFPMTVGDFNGDGKLDVAVVGNSDTSHGAQLSIFLGNGDGTFQPPLNSTLSVNTGEPTAVLAADLNGDGKLDLAFVNVGAEGLWVMLGNGDGTFQSPVSYAFLPGTATTPVSLVAGDFNGDGKLDVAVGGQQSGSVDFLYVFLGNGDGTFQILNQNFAIGGGLAVATADLNGDGKLDLVTVGSGLGMAVLLGNGDGTFAKGTFYPEGPSGAAAVVLADFNGDGKMDAAVTNINCNGPGVGMVCTTQGAVSILLGNGDGTFQAPVSYPVHYLPEPLVVGDFNGDGNLDLVAGDICSLDLALLLGNGDGTFQQASFFSPFGGFLRASGDFNGDGMMDLVLTPDDQIFRTMAFALQAPVAPSTATVNFGNQAVGTSTSQNVALTNTGNTDLAVPGVTVNGSSAANFAQTNTCGTTIPAGSSCNVTVTFTPAAAGAASGFLSVTNVTGPTVSLTGTGAAPAPAASLSTAGLAFGNQNKGTTSAAMSVTVSNTGKAALAINPNGITFTGTNAADFALASTGTCASGGTVAAGSSCHVDVTFKPSTAAAESATLNIADNAGNSPQTVALSGTGIAAIASLSATSLHFGTVRVGRTSHPETITLSNVGNTALTITSVRMGGADPKDFKASSMCGTSIAPRASCTINLSFTPRVKGTRTATLSITDNAPPSPQKITLTGVGD